MSRTVLVGDIGGTNVRFACAHMCAETGARIEQVSKYPGDNIASFDDALIAYLDQLEGERPARALFAFAGPVENGTVEMTNRDWLIDSRELAKKTGLEGIRLVNDYAAMSRGVAELGDAHFRVLHEGKITDETAPVLVSGPGTGLGMASLLKTPSMGAIRTERRFQWTSASRAVFSIGAVSAKMATMTARKMSVSHKESSPEMIEISLSPNSGKSPARIRGANHEMGNRSRRSRLMNLAAEYCNSSTQRGQDNQRKDLQGRRSDEKETDPVEY